MSEIGALSGNDWSMTVHVEGYQAKEGEDMNPSVDGVGPRYFATMGIPVVAGREFTDSDTKGAPKVAIINETMAKYFFGTDNPIGRHFGVGRIVRPPTSRLSASSRMSDRFSCATRRRGSSTCRTGRTTA